MAPTMFGMAGSLAGPLGTGFGAGVGKALQGSIRNATGETDTSLLDQTADVAATTVGSATLDAGIGKGVQVAGRLGSVRISDPSDGTIAFHPHGENEAVSDAPSRHRALKTLIKEGSKCKSIVVTWLAEAHGDDLTDDLRTYLGPTAPNELVIGAGTTGPAIDYVTEKLRHYRKQADANPPPDAASTPLEKPSARASAIPFEKVRKKYPKLIPIWEVFEKWFKNEEHRLHFNEEDLFKDIDPTLNAFNLAVALDLLVKEGYLARSYRLQIPGGEFVSGEFSSWESIPTKVHDRFGSTTYKAKDLNLVTFYRKGVADV